MFIRVKKVKSGEKEYEYAHLVSGEWRKRRVTLLSRGLQHGKGSKKEVRKFNNSIHKYHGLIGRVYRFTNKEKTSELNFFDNSKTVDIYKTLIKRELDSRGFILKDELYLKEGLFVDLNRLIVHDGRNDVVLKLKDNSGYFCSHTLRELFSIDKINGRNDGLYLMKKFKQTGIDVTPEEFFKIVSMMLEKN